MTKSQLADVIMSESRKDRKRLSRIIKVDFGKEVGISLEELEDEFDEMITELESQKANLQDFTTTEVPIQGQPTLQLDPTLTASNTSLNKKATRLKEMLNCAGKNSREPIQDASSSQLSLHDRSSPAKSYRSETNSLDLDADVFLSSTDELNGDGPIEFTAPREKRGPAHQTINWLNKKLPSSPRHTHGEGKRSCDEHVLVPPVLVDGELTSSYQYLTPSICRKSEKEKSSTLSKLMGKPPEILIKKRPKESPLKAMYEATVRNPCSIPTTPSRNTLPFSR